MRLASESKAIHCGADRPWRMWAVQSLGLAGNRWCSFVLSRSTIDEEKGSVSIHHPIPFLDFRHNQPWSHWAISEWMSIIGCQICEKQGKYVCICVLHFSNGLIDLIHEFRLPWEGEVYFLFILGGGEIEKCRAREYFFCRWINFHSLKVVGSLGGF